MDPQASEGLSELFDRIAQEALGLGRRIDLSGISYGLSHNPEIKYDPARATPCDYYYFLAGFTRLMRFSRVIEIGTHMGGSARAFARGLSQPFSGDERIVTIDPTDLSDSVLKAETAITKIQGFAEDPRVVKQVMELNRERTIDLLFLDGAHEYEATLRHFSLYSTLFCPSFALLDDICLNDSMRNLWQTLLRTFPKRAIDLAGIFPGIRRPSCGLGLILLGEDAPVIELLRRASPHPQNASP